MRPGFPVRTVPEPAIYEARAMGVKLSALCLVREFHQNAILFKPINAIWVVQSRSQKDFRIPFAQITSQPRPSRPTRGAYRDRHGRWARDAVDAGSALDET